MRATTKQIRAIIGHVDGAWVSVSRDEKRIWAGARRDATTAEVREALESAGYRCEMNGAPGTSGEHIIDVFKPEAAS